MTGRHPQGRQMSVEKKETVNEKNPVKRINAAGWYIISRNIDFGDFLPFAIFIFRFDL